MSRQLPPTKYISSEKKKINIKYLIKALARFLFDNKLCICLLSSSHALHICFNYSLSLSSLTSTLLNHVTSNISLLTELFKKLLTPLAFELPITLYPKQCKNRIIFPGIFIICSEDVPQDFLSLSKSLESNLN